MSSGVGGTPALEPSHPSDPLSLEPEDPRQIPFCGPPSVVLSLRRTFLPPLGHSFVFYARGQDDGQRLRRPSVPSRGRVAKCRGVGTLN